MTRYAVMFPADDESAWEAGTEQDHQVTYDADAEFARRLRTAGGAITGGSALASSSGARTLRRDASGDVVVSEGPALPGPIQLSGWFLVDCPDHDALLDAATALLAGHPVVEVRPLDES